MDESASTRILGEYIGCYGEELFDRDMAELQFRMAIWATGSQMVRFSKGANELIVLGRNNDRHDEGDGPVISITPKDCFDFDTVRSGNLPDDREYAWEVENEDWTLEGMATVDEDGEELHGVGRKRRTLRHGR